MKNQNDVNMLLIPIFIQFRVFGKWLTTCLCMISLRVSATKLAKRNEPEDNPKDFPSRYKTSNELYTLLCNVILPKSVFLIHFLF